MARDPRDPQARPLQRGDVLSYSAGSTSEGPDGYRIVADADGPRPSALLATLATRWPAIGALLGGPAPPLFVNAYPANVGRFAAGVVVDTYLSPKTGSRALQLAAREGLPVVLMAQPLFAAELLQYHLRAGRPLPRAMLVGVGGYPLVASLERALLGWLAGCDAHVLQLYGLAEIDSGMLIGQARTAAGEVIYFPRPDVRIAIADDTLRISRQRPDGGWPAPVDTRDRAAWQGDGVIFPGAAGRADPALLDVLEGWSPDDWIRRTGYLGRTADGIVAQVRQGMPAEAPDELDFWAFGARFGFSWLDKPRWR